jgi:hypothetical protein
MRDEKRVLESVRIFEDQCRTKTGFWNLPHFSRINARQKQIIQISKGMDDRNENNINVEIIGNNITVYLPVMVLHD